MKDPARFCERVCCFENKNHLFEVVSLMPLAEHPAEIRVSFKLREQKEPEGIFATHAFMPNNNVRNLRITYSLIIITGITAGFVTPWWRQGWIWTALGVMIVILIIMKRVSSIYLYAVDAIAEDALKKKEDTSAIDKFRGELRARREPEVLSITSVLGGLIILWLMMFKPF